MLVVAQKRRALSDNKMSNYQYQYFIAMTNRNGRAQRSNNKNVNNMQNKEERGAALKARNLSNK